MNTELRQIRHLVTLGKHLSFTKAALELGITQSALTRSIQGIEAAAQVRLFDRDRGRVTPTEVGRAYLARAENVLVEADDLDRLLQQSANAEVGEANFGVTSAVARSIMANVLLRELKERPHLNTKIHVRSPENMIEMVQNEEIEFCVCGELPRPPESLRSSIVATFPLALLVRRDHPLPADEIRLDLRDYPLVLSGQVADGDAILERLQPFRLSPARIILDEIGSLANIVSRCDAVWLTIPQAAAYSLARGFLRELPFPEELNMTFRVVMYSHARRTLSPAACRMRDRMREEGTQACAVSQWG